MGIKKFTGRLHTKLQYCHFWQTFKYRRLIHAVTALQQGVVTIGSVFKQPAPNKNRLGSSFHLKTEVKHWVLARLWVKLVALKTLETQPSPP